MDTLMAQVTSTQLDRKTFNAFRRLVYATSGIALSPAKESLVRSRIGKRMRALGINEAKNYLHRVQDDASGQELVHLLDAISTNVTSFFREGSHFEVLAEHLTAIMAAKRTRIRLWSAACSSGEEPYSMALTVLDRLPASSLDVKILATDISTKVLERCQAGRFSVDRVAPVPVGLRRRFFRESKDDDGRTWWQAGDDLRRMLVVRRLNLAEPPFPMRGPLDAIFCRNVMIYFDQTVRRALLGEIVRLLTPGGILFVGHAESLTGMLVKMRPLRPSVYVKEGP